MSTIYLGPDSLIEVSPRTLLRLKKYVGLLREWNLVTNLLSTEGLDNIWSRHIADCLQLLPLAADSKHWLDIGTGAGFPSVVVACQLADTPNARIHSVDSDGRKCVFLREVARQLELPLQVYNRRAESLTPSEIWPVDILTSRAFASLPNILHIAGSFLDAGAVALLLRGKSAASELDEIDNSCYLAECLPSESGGGGMIFRIKRRTLAKSI
jgi:16S rRNA (guanine527-N7)-methyltransferase